MSIINDKLILKDQIIRYIGSAKRLSFKIALNNKHMQLINYNGTVNHVNNTLISPNNRSFKYGDGLFETIRMFDGKFPFLKKHCKRLNKGIELLKLEAKKEFNAKFLKSELRKLAPLGGNKRFRVAVFRNEGGHYLPSSNKASFLIEASSLDANHFSANEKGIQLGIYDDFFINRDALANIKTANSLPYILASLYKTEKGWDDCLLLNRKIRIAECCSSNIFILKDKVWYTPALSEGCVDGVMRSVVIDIMKAKGLQIEETKVKLELLKKADECFLTNSIQGIQWVKGFKKKSFSNKKSNQLLKSLNKKITSKS